MPQDVELGGLREHPTDPAAVYEITLRGTPPAGLTARFPSMTLHSIPAVTVLVRRVVDPSRDRRAYRAAALHRNHATGDARIVPCTTNSGLRDDLVSRFCDPCGGQLGLSRSARWCGSLPRPGSAVDLGKTGRQRYRDRPPDPPPRRLGSGWERSAQNASGIAEAVLLCCHVTVGHEAGIAQSLILAECGVRDVDDRWPSDRTHRWNGTSRRSDPCHDTGLRCRAWSVRQSGGLLGIPGALALARDRIQADHLGH